MRFVALSGPSFAREVYERRPTAVVASSTEPAAAEEAQQVFATNRFRVYSNTDVVGVELGGALKNVIAIAAGMLDGLELGNNARAALLTRGLAEITRLGVALGASPADLRGARRHGRPDPHGHRRPEPQPGAGHRRWRRARRYEALPGAPPHGGGGRQRLARGDGPGPAPRRGAADSASRWRDPLRGASPPAKPSAT